MSLRFSSHKIIFEWKISGYSAIFHPLVVAWVSQTSFSQLIPPFLAFKRHRRSWTKSEMWPARRWPNLVRQSAPSSPKWSKKKITFFQLFTLLKIVAIVPVFWAKSRRYFWTQLHHHVSTGCHSNWASEGTGSALFFLRKVLVSVLHSL